MNLTLSSLSGFLPTIITTLGYSNARVSLSNFVSPEVNLTPSKMTRLSALMSSFLNAALLTILPSCNRLFTVPPCKSSSSCLSSLPLRFDHVIADAVALVVMLLLNYASDRMQTRGIFVAIVFIINLVGWIILLAIVHNQHARYFACFCITIGGYAAIPLIISWTCKPIHPQSKQAD